MGAKRNRVSQVSVPSLLHLQVPIRRPAACADSHGTRNDSGAAQPTVGDLDISAPVPDPLWFSQELATFDRRAAAVSV